MLVLAALAAGCEGDDLVGTWQIVSSSGDGSVVAWSFHEDGNYERPGSPDPTGTWERVDDTHVALCPLATCWATIPYEAVVGDDRLLLARVPEPRTASVPDADSGGAVLRRDGGDGELAGSTWRGEADGCCAHGRSYVIDITVQLLADDTARVRSAPLADGPLTSEEVGTWSAAALGFEVSLDNLRTGYIRVDDAASSSGYRRAD